MPTTVLAGSTPGTGVVTGVATGTANISVADPNSGVTSTPVPVTVSANPWVGAWAGTFYEPNGNGSCPGTLGAYAATATTSGSGNSVFFEMFDIAGEIFSDTFTISGSMATGTAMDTLTLSGTTLSFSW